MPIMVATLMPNTTAVPSTRRAPEPAPVAIASGSGAEDEGERGHQDRPQAQARALDRRVHQWLAALVLELGELDDEDGILCRQADQHHQPDLRVDVIRHAAQRQAAVGAEHGERDAQQHRERHRPAFVQRRQHQEHENDRHARRSRRLCRRRAFPGRWCRSTRSRSRPADCAPAPPWPASPGRSCSRGAARPVDGDGAEDVVALDVFGARTSA